MDFFTLDIPPIYFMTDTAAGRENWIYARKVQNSLFAGNISQPLAGKAKRFIKDKPENER